MKKVIQSLFIICLSFFSLSLSAQQYKLSKKDTCEVRFINSRKFWIYKVDKGETMFSISQKFKIPQEEIHEFNSEISEKGLKAKMKIWVPAYSWLNKKENKIVEDSALVVEKENKKKILKVLLLTGLNLPKQYTGGNDGDSSFVKESLPLEIRENLEFLEGVLISSKDFADASHKVELLIKDTESDSLKIVKVFSKLDLSDIDFILTNETGSRLKCINKYSLSNNIPLFSAGINTTEYIRNNEFAYSLSPSSLLQCKLMGISSAKYFKNANCIVLKSGVSREDERGVEFRNGWLAGGGLEQIKNVNFSNGYTKALKDSLQRLKMNVIFVPTSNEDIISQLLSSLKELTSIYRISVVGLPTWLFSQSIDPVLFDTCNTYLFSAGYVDFEDPAVHTFRKNFRDHYHSEPLDIAYLGYDAFQIAAEKYTPELKKRGKERKKNYRKGIYSSYHFEEAEENSCKENHVVKLFRFENSIPILFEMNNSEN